MAITPKQLVQRLEAVKGKSCEMRRHLIRCGPLDSQVIPLLKQIDASLQSIGSERELITGNEEARQLLKEIQVNTEKARLLLESAVELTCRSALAKPSIAGSYTPDGQLPALEFSGRMIVHA